MYPSKISLSIALLALIALSLSPVPASAIMTAQNAEIPVLDPQDVNTSENTLTHLRGDTSDPLWDSTVFLEMKTLRSAVDSDPDDVPPPRILIREPGIVPEPSTLLLFGAGLFSFGLFQRRMRS